MITVEIEITPTNVIPLSVPDEQFVLRADAEAIAREIPGTNVVGSMLTAGESLVSSDPNDKREWLNIAFDPTHWPHAKFAEPAFRVLKQKAAFVAQNKSYTWKDNADGYPNAEEVVVPKPDPVVVNNGTGSFMPGATKTAQDVWDYLQKKFGPA